MIDVGKNIKGARLAAGLTQDELAERVHVARQTVSNYETGFSRPDVDMLAQLAEALGTDVNQLIYGGQDQGPEKEKRPAPTVDRRQALLLTAALVILALLLLVYNSLLPVARNFQTAHYHTEPGILMLFWYRPLLCLLGGWTLLQLLGTLFGLGRLPAKTAKWVRIVTLICLGVYVLIMLPYGIQTARQLISMLVTYRRTGRWYGGNVAAGGIWQQLIRMSSQMYSRVNRLGSFSCTGFFLLGILLWLSGRPKTKEKAEP